MREIFPALFGNEATKSRIGDAILSSRLPHALLIDGQEGSGKYTLALEIAAAVNCERRGDPNASLPCHGCPRCKRIFGGGFVDLHTLERDESRATIGVDPVKEMRRDMFLSATEADFKVYIVKDAEKLTTEAQNALLIVLEEPPEGVLIMLLASGTDKILTTIKSRTQYIPMSRFSTREIGEYLLKTDKEAERVHNIDPEGFGAAVASADGRIGLAKELITPESRERIAEERAETLAIIASLGRGKGYRDIYAAVGDLPKKRAELAVSLERLMQAVAELIKVGYSGEGVSLSFFRSAEEAETVGESISRAKLFKLYDIVSRAYEDNSKNANTAALLSTLSAELRMA